uniref:K Homology domain-containing protein n=1 Tax=Brassica oleracea var. oleracea TaxID=109376 RepID=A0A0D3DN75_BRAOL
MSMKLSEDFTKKLGFSEEGEEIRKLERSWSKLEDSVEFDEEEEAGEEEEFSFACVNAEGSPITAEEAFEDATCPWWKWVCGITCLKRSYLSLALAGRSGSVITQIRKRTNASIRISKGNNVDLVEVIMILTKVQIFSPSPFVSSVPEYASIDFDQRRETWESSLGMVSSDRFYGYESSFPLSSHFEFF